MTLAWLQEASEYFWSNIGDLRSFPCNIEKAAIHALPVGILSLPRLWISDLAFWMEKRGLTCPFDGDNRPLRGCLVAFKGKGLIIVNGQDSEDERRFTVAHEIAHFILGYLQARKRVLDLLGPDSLDILDGIRPATTEERVFAILGSTDIGVHTHAMDRSPIGDIFQGAVLKTEENADLLALELLAPEAEIKFKLKFGYNTNTFIDLMNYITGILKKDYGIPASMAKPYAYYLADNLTRGPSVKEWLGL
jgi:Zn-dependent peptidase ImmA (M78 family)